MSGGAGALDEGGMSRKRHGKGKTGGKDDWAAMKRACRLSADDVHKAKELGMTPRSLLKNRPSRHEPWKMPVKFRVRELHEKRFGRRRAATPAAPAEGPHRAPRPEPCEPEELGLEDEPEDLPSEDEWEEPSEQEIEEQDRAMLRRQREFGHAAEYVARRLAAFPCVDRVTLFGSVAAPLEREIPRFSRYRRHRIEVLHECHDVNLAVHVNRLDRLNALRRASSRALNELLADLDIGVAHHQVDICLVESGTERYLGNLCHYSRCPADKPACRVPGCGEAAFLQRFEGFRLEAGAWRRESAVVLFERRQS